ncbi:alpha/beta fold hydrolase [Venatoribacter cucullus]|uniref:Alpha/beta fold hydrolase n=1 Tax=Venatoribacter cucullus TaxID=2661630 RepID=A0A9X7UX82_9GAMM|nr:alpha/beta fold hydrolase [Venatoribacter cucullus]QQD24579.1 alpha/beta fold hydrolase [Venatoribacter cucullus]
MPLITSSYTPPPALANGYVQSILPTLVRRLPSEHLQRERLELGDGDFLDLDWSRCAASTQPRPLVIISHGLEGHSRRPYVLGVARQANRQGFDALAWNFRACSGEPNRLPRMYHSGATEDLHAVVQHAVACGYQRIHLVGFSMGGNLSLVYAGREAAQMPAAVRSVVAFSVPCDLHGSALQLAKRRNRIFMWRFLRDLGEKMRIKAQRFPQLISVDGYQNIRNFQQFDDRYTAPLHGFRDALDYWQQSSSLNYLAELKVPTLLVNARNDPFLSAACFPQQLAQQHEFLHLEIPASGGHVGFIRRSKDQTYWMELRALEFIAAQEKRVPASLPDAHTQPLTTSAS